MKSITWVGRRARLWVAIGTVLVALLQVTVASAQEGPKNEPKRVAQQDLTEVFRRTASGPAWLVAEGLDPRLYTRPGWDTLTRLAWRDLDSSFSSPGRALQQAGGGGSALVPFRDPAPAFSRNILITRDFSASPYQTEPHVVVNPNDPDHVVMGAIDYNFPTVTTYITFDGGRTWEGPRQLPFLQDDLTSAGDPVLAFGDSGLLHSLMISLGTEDFQVGPFVFTAVVSSIALTTSGDGGLTWGEAVSTARSDIISNLGVDLSGRQSGNIVLSFLDKPWLAVGPHPDDPSREMVYVTYTEFATTVEVLYIGEIPAFAVGELLTTIYFVSSDDGGRTWSAPIAVSPTVRRAVGESPEAGEGVGEGLKRVVQGSQPAVAPDGTVYVAWMDTTNDDSQEGLAEIYVARSDDGGVSFTDPLRASLFREIGFRPKTAFFRYWGSAFPQLAVGPQGQVYIVYVGLNPAKPTDDGDVWFIRSLDRGNTWDRAMVLGGDETGRAQFFPAIDTDPQGNLHVMWGDMRDDPAQTRYHIYYTRSDDQGRSWGFANEELGITAADTRISDFPSNPNYGFPFGLFIGDYFAIAATDDEVYAVWADTRLGEYGPPNQKIGFARRSAMGAPEVFLSPGAGPGGQDVTLQGFNFQPDLNVFIQVGGVVIGSERTGDEGRFTSRFFMPVSGEGPQDVRVFDESGNLAATSFFTEFGFGNLWQAQVDLEAKLDGLAASLGVGPITPVSSDDGILRELEELQRLVREQDGGGGFEWWAVAAGVVVAAAAGVAGGAYVTVFRSRRQGTNA